MNPTKCGSIWVTRALAAGAHARFECRPGELTILSDEDGNDLGHFEQAFRVARSSPGFEITRGDVAIDLGSIERLGFEDRLSVELTIPDYLKTLGLSESETENILMEFDLVRVRYLYCSQLPLPAARQLQIFELLRRDWTVLFLRDPFQPLNGRWREDFARRLMQEVKRRSAVAVASSINFIPQSWNGIGIRNFDVGKLCAASVARATTQREQRASVVDEGPDISDLQAKPVVLAKTTSATTLPETLPSSYQVITDFIFEPLASLSNLFRQNTIATMCVAIVLALGLVASIAIPNLSHNQYLLQTIALKAKPLTPEEQDIKTSAVGQTASIDLPVDGQKADTSDNEFESSLVENPEELALAILPDAKIAVSTEVAALNFTSDICAAIQDFVSAEFDSTLNLESLIIGTEDAQELHDSSEKYFSSVGK